MEAKGRALANYRPSVWGDFFLQYASTSPEAEASNNEVEKEYERLKEEVRKRLISPEDSLLEKLNLIDAVERLGVAYHFTKEINDALEKIYKDCNLDHDESNSLYVDALRFRLLRQHGFKASCDVFEKFKDGKGDFKESIVSDIPGMLSLYEAAYLAVRGETILDDAIAFTTTHLRSELSKISSTSLAKQVTRALYRPIHRCLERLEARYYLPIYEENASHNKALLRFAKFDFNKVQEIHQKELAYITKWWKDLDFARKLPYARDRVVEAYFWMMGFYYEPQFEHARRMLTKVTSMTSIIDDTYDSYGTLEELKPYTEAIQRWDKSAMDILPEYMKPSFLALLDVYDEIEELTTKEGRPHCVHYAKEAMKRLVRGYFQEAIWFHEGFVPPMEVHTPNGLISCGYPMLAVTSFVGMKEGTKEAFEWVSNDPKMVKGAAFVCRFMDDIVSHKLEQARGHVASGIECYMNEHPGVSEEQVYDLFRKLVEDAWKDINEECLDATNVVPLPLLKPILNSARAMEFIYKEDDGYTHNSKHFMEAISLVLIDPVPI